MHGYTAAAQNRKTGSTSPSEHSIINNHPGMNSTGGTDSASEELRRAYSCIDHGDEAFQSGVLDAAVRWYLNGIRGLRRGVRPCSLYFRLFGSAVRRLVLLHVHLILCLDGTVATCVQCDFRCTKKWRLVLALRHALPLQGSGTVLSLPRRAATMRRWQRSAMSQS